MPCSSVPLVDLRATLPCLSTERDVVRVEPRAGESEKREAEVNSSCRARPRRRRASTSSRGPYIRRSSTPHHHSPAALRGHGVPVHRSVRLVCPLRLASVPLRPCVAGANCLGPPAQPRANLETSLTCPRRCRLPWPACGDRSHTMPRSLRRASRSARWSSSVRVAPSPALPPSLSAPH